MAKTLGFFGICILTVMVANSIGFPFSNPDIMFARISNYTTGTYQLVSYDINSNSDVDFDFTHEYEFGSNVESFFRMVYDWKNNTLYWINNVYKLSYTLESFNLAEQRHEVILSTKIDRPSVGCNFDDGWCGWDPHVYDIYQPWTRSSAKITGDDTNARYYNGSGDHYAYFHRLSSSPFPSDVYMLTTEIPSSWGDFCVQLNCYMTNNGFVAVSHFHTYTSYSSEKTFHYTSPGWHYNSADFTTSTAANLIGITGNTWSEGFVAIDDVYISKGRCIEVISAKYYGIDIDPFEQRIYLLDGSGIDYIETNNTANIMHTGITIEQSGTKEMQVDEINRFIYILTNSSVLTRVSLDNVSVTEELLISEEDLLFTLSTSNIYLLAPGTGDIQEAALNDGDITIRTISNVPIPSEFSGFELISWINVYGTSIFGGYKDPEELGYGFLRIDIHSGEIVQINTDGYHFEHTYIHTECQPSSCSTECLNGGVCVTNDDNAQMCKCPYGFVGWSCKRSVGYCACGDTP